MLPESEGGFYFFGDFAELGICANGLREVDIRVDPHQLELMFFERTLQPAQTVFLIARYSVGARQRVRSHILSLR